jgi:hypothetical protein
VDSIIQRTRVASAAELEFILSNSAALRLTLGGKNQLSLDLTIQIAQARQSNGRRKDPNARFVAQVFGLLPTPFGLVEREFVEGQLRSWAQAISRCKLHRLPLCSCWASQRAILWQVQSAHGERTPEFWTATRVYAFLEDLELFFSARTWSGACMTI